MIQLLIRSTFCIATALAGFAAHAGLYEIDPAFATAGRFNATFSGSDFRTLAHLARPDGSSVAVVTYDNNGCPSGRHCLALYPFSAAGVLGNPVQVPNSHSFSKRTGGIIAFDSYLVRSAAIDSQNRIIIAGSEQFGTVTQFKVIRLLATGQPDTSFDGDGIALPGNFTAQNQDFAEAVAVDSVDRIVLAGRAAFSASDTDFAILRLSADGTLDNSFSGDGKLTIAFDLAGAGIDGATALDIRPGGQIYLAGSAKDGSITRIALAKVLPAGTLDANFCPTTCTFQGPYTAINNGKRVIFYGAAGDNLSDFVSALAVNVSGEMVYAGEHATTTVGVFQIFTQKIALNGDFANEGLSDVGLAAPLSNFIGGIRYFNKNSPVSDLVLTGAIGPNREFFFAQGLEANLVPKNGWGTGGTNNSALLYSAAGTFGDNPGNRPAMPSIDTAGRVLLGGSYKATAVDPNYSINLMRLRTLQFDRFANGFE
jgi:uncharacterized delta-60 repeat protein